jgi:hypothetical protein
MGPRVARVRFEALNRDQLNLGDRGLWRRHRSSRFKWFGWNRRPPRGEGSSVDAGAARKRHGAGGAKKLVEALKPAASESPQRP